MGLHYDVQSPTALIPVGFGVILLLCTIGLKKENKIIAHVAVLLTLVILVALVGMRLPKSLVFRRIGIGACERNDFNVCFIDGCICSQLH